MGLYKLTNKYRIFRKSWNWISTEVCLRIIKSGVFSLFVRFNAIQDVSQKSQPFCKHHFLYRRSVLISANMSNVIEVLFVNVTLSGCVPTISRIRSFKYTRLKSSSFSLLFPFRSSHHVQSLSDIVSSILSGFSFLSRLDTMLGSHILVQVLKIWRTDFYFFHSIAPNSPQM